MCLPGDTPGLISGGGHRYPAVLLGGVADTPGAAVRAVDRPAEIDAVLEAAGAPHVAAVRRAGAVLWDGPVLTYDGLADGAVICRRSRYLTVLATSGALGAELSAAGPGARMSDLPLRRRAVARAGGDPIARGRGRAAAVGLNIALIATGGGRRRALLGRRSATMAAMPGMWSFVAGNIEPADGTEPLESALGRELAEEMPALSPSDAATAASRARVYGACLSLGRLGPSLLASAEMDGTAADLGHLDPGEFDLTRIIDLDDPAACWEGLSPRSLVPASAALLRELLSRR